jgi:Ca2+-binding RTX toxin-like protein
VQAFNAGVQQVRQGDQIVDLVNASLGTNLPLIEESVAQLVDAAERFATPFLEDLNDVVSGELAELEAMLVSLGFTNIHCSLTPDASGDLLRATYEYTWHATNALPNFSVASGFNYFDSGTSGGLDGNLSATIEPVILTVTLGVDLVNDVPTFFVSENSTLTAGGITLSGTVDTNLGIRNLLDVDVAGTITGHLGGAISFVDPDPDDKLRVIQFANPTIVQKNLTGNVKLDTELTANLPLIGSITWGGVWTAGISDGSVSIDNPTLSPPSTATVQDLVQDAYQTIVEAFDLFGDINLGETLSGVGKGIGDVLGLPSFLTDGSLGTVGTPGFQINVTPQSVFDFINGNVVDLIRFESSGGDKDEIAFDVPLAAAAVPLGPIPLTVTLSFQTGVQYGWSYFAGLGVDTTGFYIDPNTRISAFGSIEAGLSAKLSLAGIAGVDVTGGVGGKVDLSARLHDPDPSDGKIYLDELIRYDATSVGNAILNAMDISLGGEAYAYARGEASIGVWKMKYRREIFNERNRIESFNAQLTSNNHSQSVDVANSLRTKSQRNPTGSDESADDNSVVLQNGVLAINAQHALHIHSSNTISISAATNGGIELNWQGAGRRNFAPGTVQSIVYVGNDHDDRLYVGNNVLVPVTAHGHGGNDAVTVMSAPAKLYGGADDDTLRGGSGNDELYGGDGNDLLLSGGGDDKLNGEIGDDRLEGGGGNDQLFGGVDDDFLLGGNGDDDLDGGAGNDSVYGGAGDDHLIGGTDNDMLYGEIGTDILHGGAEIDVLDGGLGQDFLYGEDGEDQLIGGEGDDQLFGGAHDDILLGGAGNDDVEGGTGDDQLFGEAGDDELQGGAGEDRLFGGDANDLLHGGDADDQLYGEGGNDTLYGGAGDDELNGGLERDVLYGEAGSDTLQISFAAADNIADELHGGLDRDQLAIVGSMKFIEVNGILTLDNTIDDFIQIEQLSGENFRAVNRNPVTAELLQAFPFTLDASLNGDIEELAINGLGGNDRLEVVGGLLSGKNLILEGGDGYDVLIGGPGRDFLDGGLGNDKLIGGDDDDILEGGEGDDNLDGNGGLDTLYGGAGNDYIYGGDAGVGGIGRDLIYGGLGNDKLIAGAGFYGSIIYGDGDKDVIIGSSGIDFLDGGSGDDLIVGGDLGDTIRGGVGNDLLVGEFGRDNIAGESDDDLIYTHLNNDLRASVGLGPVAELTLAERNSRYSQLINDLPALQNLNSVLLAIPESQRTPQQIAQLVAVQDAIAVNLLSQADLLQYQSVYVDIADGANGNDTIYGSPNLDVLSGGDGDDHIYASRGLLPGGLQQGDIINGGNGSDTVWFEGTEGNDDITIFTEADGDTGNRYVVIDLDGDGIREGIIQQLTIENVGVRARGGDDVVTIEFGNLALVNVAIDGGAGHDILLAERLDEKLPNGTFVPVPASTLKSRTTLRNELKTGTVIPISTLQSKATFYGGAGNDIIIGGLNNDFLYGDGGNDILIGGPALDAIEGGSGNDWIDGGGGIDHLYGGLGHDVIYGGLGDDSLYGGVGHDEIITGPGHNYIYALGLPDEDVIEDESGSSEIVWGPTAESPPIIVESSSNDRWKNLPLVQGNEFRVNTATQSSQSDPAIAMAADGKSVLVWTGVGEDGSDYGIYARLYSATGEPQADAFRVNDFPAHGIQGTPAIAMASDGSFVIAWTSYQAEDGSNSGVYARRYDAAGRPLAETFLVNTVTDGWQEGPAIAFATDGSFAIAWTHLQTSAGWGLWKVHAQRFSSTGEQLGDYFQVNTSEESHRFAPAIAFAADGSFVITWTSRFQDGSGDGIYAQRYNAAGEQFGPEFQVNTATYSNQHSTAIAATPDGGFVITWSSEYQDGSGTGVYATRFDALGNPLPRPVSAIPGEGNFEFRVNTHTYDAQIYPAIATTADGGFIITWMSHGQDGSGGGIYAQRFSAGGERLGGEFRVNATVYDAQEFPVIAVSADGSFVIAWQSHDQDGDGYGVYARRYHLLSAADPRNAERSWWSRTISFSSQMANIGAGDVTNLANWQLLRDDLDVTNDIVSIEQFVDPQTYRTDITLTFAGPTLTGNYKLIAKAAIADLNDHPLDGNGDGIGGDDYVDRFTISSPPLALGSTIDVTTVAVAPADAVMAVNPLDRSYVVVWTGPGVIPGELDIYARKFDASGSPLGVAARVNTFTDANQIDPAIAMDDSGNYVIVWSTSASSITPNSHVVSARRFSASGTALGPQFQMSASPSPTTGTTRPRVATDSNGDFVVVWQANISSEGYEIYGQRFSKDGLSVGPQFVVNSQASPGLQWMPDVAMDRDGNFIVTWVDEPTSNVMARYFSATGVADEAFFVSSNLGVSDNPRIAMNRDGEFAIVWQSEASERIDVYAQRYDSQRRLMGGEFKFHAATIDNQKLPDVAIDHDGNLAFAWTGDNGLHVSWFDKWGGLLADKHVPLGVEATAPKVGMAPDGEFFLMWHNEPESHIQIQRFTRRPPTVLDVSPSPGGQSIIVAFSQEMATSGAGSVLEAENWILRLPDGRYLAQADRQLGAADPRATPEQLGEITFGFNPTTKRWEAVVALDFVATVGTYELIARSSLRDAAGHSLDGNGDGLPTESHTAKFTVTGTSGDFDGDGDVDGGDFLVWQRNPNAGSVIEWKNNYGTSSLATLAALYNPGFTVNYATVATENTLDRPQLADGALIDGELKGIRTNSFMGALSLHSGDRSITETSRRIVDEAYTETEFLESQLTRYPEFSLHHSSLLHQAEPHLILFNGDEDCERDLLDSDEAFESLFSGDQFSYLVLSSDEGV